MRESQYVEAYLRQNARKPYYTIGTFLAYRLRGEAKKYATGYMQALQAAVDRRVKTGLAEEVVSAGKRRAYRYREAEQGA